MRNIHEVTLVGPLNVTPNGQSIAFQQTVDATPHSRTIDNACSSISKIIYYYCVLFIAVINCSGPIYFTCSRTIKGFFVRDFPLLLLCRTFGRRIINHVHGSDFTDFRCNTNYFVRWLIDWAYSWINDFIAPSESCVEQFALYQGALKHVVYNFYSNEFSDLESRSKQSNPRRSTRILYLSNLLYSKGFSILIETVEHLTKRGVDLKLDICGAPQGDEFWSEQQVKEYLSKIDNPNIHYHGPIYGPKKVKFFCDSDVFVLPSFYKTEEAPLSIIEALASGCYIVTSTAGSIPNMLSGTISSIVNPSVLSLTQALLEYEALSIHERRLISKTNQSVASLNFAPEKYNDAITKIIRG